MDRLGLPVFASIRPRGRTLRVHAGKGIEPIAARVGALMEAIEFAVAEPARTNWRPQPMAVGRFLDQFEGQADLIDFAPILGRSMTLDEVLVTVPCEDIRSGSTAGLPAELVFMPFDRGSTQPIFGWSSNGLASGNSVTEATLHALLEVLERDAISMNTAREHSRWIGSGLPEPFDRLVAQWRTLGIETAVRWVPTECGIACFRACLHEPGRGSVHLAGGSGAHPDPQIALSRALCEAAQSRLSFVHGGRDDIVEFFDRYQGLDEDSRNRRDGPTLERLFDQSRPMDFADVPGPLLRAEEVDLEDLLSDLLDRLAAVGFGHVYRYRFDIALGGLEVVRVLVPRCEDVENGPLRMGRRLFQRVTGTTLP